MSRLGAFVFFAGTWIRGWFQVRIEECHQGFKQRLVFADGFETMTNVVEYVEFRPDTDQVQHHPQSPAVFNIYNSVVIAVREK